jgi:hypothetical protein
VPDAGETDVVVMANVKRSGMCITQLLLGVLLLFPAGRAWAKCLGDCDNSGTVGSGDLTKIIAIMNYCPCGGAAIGGAPDGCDAIPGSDKQCVNTDRDGNNCITAGELTGVIADMINFPDGCSAIPTPTHTPTPSPTSSPPATEPVATGTPSTTETATRTTIPTGTATRAPTATATVAPTATATQTATATDSPAPTEAATPTATEASAPTATATTHPTSTSTATATATAASSTVCGNGVIEAGETCATCAVDCTVHSCTATTPVRTVKVNLTIPPEETVSGLTLLVGYKSGTVSLPGSGAASTVGSRIKNKPSNIIFAINDLDYALRTVLSRSAGFSSGQLYTIDFDSCQGAAPPIAADFGCTVEGCSNTFGTVTGCSCSVTF